MDPSRPTVSRETRLLLAIVLISLSMLWVLAKIRFPGRATSSPVPPVLAQLTPPSAFDDIASTVAQLGPRLAELLIPLEATGAASSVSAGSAAITPALRVRDDLAVALTDAAGVTFRTSAGDVVTMVARDPLSRLTVLRVPAATPPALAPWAPRALQSPRFLIAADVLRDGTSLRPVFIGSLFPQSSPAGGGAIWAVPDASGLQPGTFVFTPLGDLAGLAIDREGGRALIPGETVLAAVERLAREPMRTPAWLGVEVQALTPTLAAALRATDGVVVTWTDPKGPAAGILSIMDVIEAVNGRPVGNAAGWASAIGGLSAGDAPVLTIRRGRDSREARLTAASVPAPAPDATLGLTLRSIARVGVEVLRVRAGSAADRAGLRAGDLVTQAGDVRAPSAAQLSQLFESVPAAGTLAVAFTRGPAHHVAALEKPR